MSLYYHKALSLKQAFGACVICQTNVIERGFLCEACHDGLPPVKSFVLHDAKRPLRVLPAFAYAGVVGRAIGAFKDNENVHALPILIHSLLTLGERLQKLISLGRLSANSVILPVPTTSARLAEKGVYTVGILADYLSQMSGLPLYTGVIRVLDGQRQRELGRDERLNNVRDAFLVQTPPQSSSVIIIDDVITTGATVQAIADALWADDDTLQIMAVCLAHGN